MSDTPSYAAELREVDTTATTAVALFAALRFAMAREDEAAVEFWGDGTWGALQGLTEAVIALQQAGWR